MTAHCHYDGYHNFYAQLSGRKKFTLVSPKYWREVAVYPLLHPSHAQCQANLSADVSLGTSIEYFETELGPGDVLYLPPLYFHHVEAVSC